MAQYAIVISGVVANVVLLDDGGDWTPPDGASLVASDEARIGDTYDGQSFTRDEPEPDPPTPLPDVNGFRMAAFQQLTPPVVRGLLTKYPDFNILLDAGNWAYARGTLDEALAEGNLTQAEHDTLTGLLAANHIP